MSSQSTNSVDRDVLREKERQARARAFNRGGRSNGPGGSGGGGNGGPGGGMEEHRESTPKPFFPQPIKVDPALEDETSRKIRNTLGDFREVQRYLEADPKHLIGISSNPASVTSSNSVSQGQHHRLSSKDTSSHHDDHNVKKGMANGQYKSPSFGGSSSGGGGNGGGSMGNYHRNNRGHHPSQQPKHSQQSQNSSSGPSIVGSSNYQAQSGGGRGNKGKDAEPPPTSALPTSSSKGHRKKIPYPLSSSSSHGNRVINSSSGTSSTVNPASSTTLKDGRPNKMNNSSLSSSSRPDSRRSNNNNALQSDPHGGSSSAVSKSGLDFNSSSSRGASNNSSYHNSHNGDNLAQSNNLPRIPKLPSAPVPNDLPLDPACGSTVELETILQEMKQGVPPPLSAIETPRVEDSRCFFSPDPISDDPGHITSQSSNTQNRGRNWTSRGRSTNGGRRQDKQPDPPTLGEDLAISESDDDGDLPQKNMSHRLSDCRSPSASYGFQYGGPSDNHSSQRCPPSRHVGGVPGTPPGTPPDSPPSSPRGSSPRSVNGSPLHSLPGSAINSPPGSLAGSPRAAPHGSPIHSPMDLDPPSPPRSNSVVSNHGSDDSSNNSSSACSDGESSDEDSDDKEDVEEDHKDSDDLNDDLKERGGPKEKEFEANMVDERGGNVDDGPGDDSTAKNNWSLKYFMEKKNSPALPTLATPGRSGLGFRSDRLGSDNTVASCDGKGDKSNLHLGHDSLADHYSVSEFLNPTPDIKEILRSPTPYIMELDNMRPNHTASSSQGDLMSPINSPETPAGPPMHRQENLRVQSSSSDSKRHSSSYYNPASSLRTSVSPCGKRNNGRDEESSQPVRARTANKTSKHKSRRDMHKSRQNISDQSDSDYEDKKSVSPKRSSSASSSCPSPQPPPSSLTVTSSRKNDSSADSRKPRPVTGKKGMKKPAKGPNANKMARSDEKEVKNKRTSSASTGRSVSPRENVTVKATAKPKMVKREKVKEKPPPVIKEAPRKTPKMPGRPPGSGKVASKTVATTKKCSGDESDKNRKGKAPVFKSREYIESSDSDSSANSASEDESAASNAEEEDEAGEVGETVFGKSPRKKPFAMVHPLPPQPPMKPLPVKAVIAPITKPEITLPTQDFSVPIKNLTPGRPPGKTKSSKEKIALVGSKKMPVPDLEDDRERSEAVSTPNCNRVEYNEEVTQPRVMVRISLTLLDRIPRYPPVSRKTTIGDRLDYHKVTAAEGDNGSRLSSKRRDVSQERYSAENATVTKRDSSRESVVRAKDAKAQDSVKKRNSSMEAASRPSKCRTPPPATTTTTSSKRKLKDEDKKEVPYAKRQKIKVEKNDTTQSERSNVVMDEEMRYDNVTSKMQRSDSVSSLASFTSQQSHHGSLRSATPTGSKRSSKKDKSLSKEIKKEVPVEQAPKSNVSTSRAGAITPSESKVKVKKELTSNVASVVSEKEARKKEKEEKRKHRNRSKEKPDSSNTSNSSGNGKSGESASQASTEKGSSKDIAERPETDVGAKVKRMKMSPKREPQDDESSSQQRVTSLKGGGGGGGGKESSKGGEKKNCDKEGPIENSASTTQSRLDYEPRDERSSSDYYLGEAKRLKHQADKEENRTLQVTTYLEAVLYFILTGNAMEDAHHDKDKVYTMYKETLQLIKSISSSKFHRNQGSTVGSTDNKLAVLSLRCQSRLYLKLYTIRKSEVKELQRKIMEFQKTPAGKLAAQLSLAAGNAIIPSQLLTNSHLLKSPCQPGRGLGGGNGVPSPHSPTPSPAGSVASVGSQSSGYSSSELNGNGRNSLPNNGSSGHPQAPGSIVPPGNLSHQSTSGSSSVSIPAIIYDTMQRQRNHYYNLQQCHDLWELGDHLTFCHSKEFFDGLDKTCGKLTLHSTLFELVQYVFQGLNRLKDSDT